MKLAARLGALVLLLACTAKQPEAKPEKKKKPDDDLGLVLAGTPQCGRCTVGPEGQCHIDDGEPHIAPGEMPREYRIPCEVSCCDRFPIFGGIALLRPGKPLFDGPWSDPPVQVARIPRGKRGLLVRVTGIEYEDEDEAEDNPKISMLQIETVGPPPESCTSALDDLEDVMLEGAVKPAHLEPVSAECAAAVHAAGDPERSTVTIPGMHTIAAGTFLDYPVDPKDDDPHPHGANAGQLINSISLPIDTRFTREHEMDCFRFPGILQPKVCVKATELERAAPP